LEFLEVNIVIESVLSLFILVLQAKFPGRKTLSA